MEKHVNKIEKVLWVLVVIVYIGIGTMLVELKPEPQPQPIDTIITILEHEFETTVIRK